MRIADIDELLEGYKREGIDPAPYYWFVPFQIYLVYFSQLDSS